MRADQIAAAQAEINAARDAYEAMKAIPAEQRDGEEFAKVSAAYEDALQNYTGPGVGLIYDDDTRTLKYADGWVEGPDGNIVKADDITGPGV